MEFDQGKPIYIQISDWMADKILRGEWRGEERIPSVRDVAMVLQVNPNTAMRAYESLQSEGVIYNKRGIGYFASTDARPKILGQRKAVFLGETLPDIFSRMELLDLSIEDMNREYEKHKTTKR